MVSRVVVSDFIEVKDELSRLEDEVKLMWAFRVSHAVYKIFLMHLAHS